MTEIAGTPVVAGRAEGHALKLDQPLSFWGGLDSETGTIVGRHERASQSITGRVLCMPSGRGSSSSSSVLAEALNLGTGPAAIVVAENDEIVALGSLVAAELYGVACPVVLVSSGDLARIPDESEVTVNLDGTIVF